MRRRLAQVSLFLAISKCLALSTYAAENPKVNNFADDSRLVNKVSIRAIGISLTEFLEKLSAKTGVKFTADKEVSESKLAVFVKDIPILKLQSAIGAALYLQSSREKGKDGKWQYNFQMDSTARAEAAANRRREIENLRKYVQELAAASKLSPEELKSKYQEIDPIYLDLRDEINIMILRLYDALPTSKKNILWQSSELRISSQQMTPEFSALLLAALNQRTNEWQEAAEQQLQTDSENQTANTKATNAKAAPWKSIGSIVFTIKQDDLDFGAVLECTIYGEKERTSEKVADAKNCTHVITFANLPREETLKDNEAADEKADGAWPKPKAPTRPPVQLQLNKPLALYHLLDEIAQQTGIPIITEYFTYLAQNEWEPEELDEPEPPESFIYRIAFLTDCEVAELDGIYVISSPNWFRYRQREIPCKLLARWKQIKKQRGLGLQELFEIAALNDRQLDDLSFYGLGDGKEIKNNKRLLLFLGSLTPQQRAKAETNDGLPFDELSENQRKLLKSWATSDEYSASIWKDQASDTRNEQSEFVTLKLKQSRMRIGNGPWIPIWSISVHRRNGTGSGTFLDTAQMLNPGMENDMDNPDSCGWMEIGTTNSPAKATVR